MIKGTEFSVTAHLDTSIRKATSKAKSGTGRAVFAQVMQCNGDNTVSLEGCCLDVKTTAKIKAVIAESETRPTEDDSITEQPSDGVPMGLSGPLKFMREHGFNYYYMRERWTGDGVVYWEVILRDQDPTDETCDRMWIATGDTPEQAIENMYFDRREVDGTAGVREVDETEGKL